MDKLLYLIITNSINNMAIIATALVYIGNRLRYVFLNTCSNKLGEGQFLFLCFVGSWGQVGTFELRVKELF